MKSEKAGAQASLEMAIAITCVLILFLGSIRLFFWLTQRLVLRQEAYESTRVSAAAEDRTTPLHVDDSSFPKLRLLDPGAAGTDSSGSTSGSSSCSSCQEYCNSLTEPGRTYCLANCQASCSGGSTP